MLLRVLLARSATKRSASGLCLERCAKMPHVAAFAAHIESWILPASSFETVRSIFHSLRQRSAFRLSTSSSRDRESTSRKRGFLTATRTGALVHSHHPL